MPNPGYLTIKAGLQVLKPVAQVFEAIVDPAHMSNYFISHASGPMESGKTIAWQFPEMEMSFPVRVADVKPNESISFYWDEGENETFVEIQLRPTSDGSTFIKITEGKKPADDAGIAWYGRNTEGWANFLACMKAYLEYGINLRKGAFIPEQMPPESK